MSQNTKAVEIQIKICFKRGSLLVDELQSSGLNASGLPRMME